MATKDELLRAIRENCMDCCGGSRKNVKNCRIDTCPLWPYRTSEKARDKEGVEGQMSIFQMFGETAAV
jgi:hypothetical protein